MDQIRVFEQLSQIYHSESQQAQTQRYKEITKRFKKEFNTEPMFFVRAPGRVNIIGDQVEFMQYPVLSMAIERDTIFALNFCEEKQYIFIKNMQKAKYPEHVFDVTQGLKFFEKENPLNWLNFVITGYKAAAALLNLDIPGGIMILVESNLPKSSGLSYSNAITTAACLSFILSITGSEVLEEQGENFELKDIRTISNQLSKLQIAESIQKCKASGGISKGKLNQLVCVTGDQNKVNLISSNTDIQIDEVTIPEDLCFVIANSNQYIPKLQTLVKGYNCRLAESRLGVYLICQFMEIEPVKSLKELQEKLGCNLQELKDYIKKYLKPYGYTIQEMNQVCQTLFQKELSQVISDISYADQIITLNKFLHPYKRLMHAIEENERAIEFCQCEDPEILGQIMNQSHESCKTLFECSCPEVDRLIELSLKSGALGARITGKGWGGCVVILVRKQDKENLIQNLEQFYLEGSQWITDNLDYYLFQCSPGSSACALDPSFSQWF